MRIIKAHGINSQSDTSGCRDAGNSILAELKNIWSNEKNKIIKPELLDIEEIHVDNQKFEEQEQLIYKNSKEELEKQDKIIFLGGDHSISFSTCRAFLENCNEKNKKPCLIVFDAHADCKKPGKNQRNREWLRALIEKGFPTDLILIVGARNYKQEEIEFLARNKIKQINMNELNNNLEEASDIIMEFACGKELYISFDIDVIDPAFASSTGYKEPGGLTSRQAIYLLGRMSLMKNLRAIDIVEVNSEIDKENNNLTVKLASKLVAELL